MAIETAGDVPFGNITRQMTRMLDQMQKGYYNFCPSETWTPTVNLYESETDYHVCVDLAGVDKDKIDLVVADGRLTLKGTRHVPTCQEIAAESEQQRRVRVHVMEIDHGSFCRVVEIPNDVHQERIVAQYDDGLLWIHLPKK
jgi:HSP20 family protein